MCKHTEARRQPQVYSQECCPLLWTQCLPLSRSSPIRQAWLAGEPQWSFALHFHSSGITSAYHYTWHFYVGSRNQIQVHRLDKCLTDRTISLSLSSRSANKAPRSERLELLCLQDSPALAEMSPLRLERAGSLSSSLFGAMYSQSVLGQQPMEKYHIGMHALSLLPPSASLLLFPSILSPDHQSLLLRSLALPHSLLWVLPPEANAKNLSLSNKTKWPQGSPRAWPSQAWGLSWHWKQASVGQHFSGLITVYGGEIILASFSLIHPNVEVYECVWNAIIKGKIKG